jgi:uncharacterized protein YkwD
MGIESRDWYREESRQAQARGISRGELVVVLLVAAALVLAVSPPVRHLLGYELPLGLDNVFRDDRAPGALRVQPLPGGPSFTIGKQPLYAPGDPWRPWLADEATCPRGEDSSASGAVQTQVLLCLVNYARDREGLQPLALSGTLSQAAAAKADDISRCGKFEHEACGRPFDQAARDVGYQGSIGENLYMAEGPLAAPRVALDRWLNSPGHRENLFRPEWTTIGIALLAHADVEQVRDGAVWVNEFGTTAG